MANENHDPWALLREARARLFPYFRVTSSFDSDLKRRIDAALAAHDAVPPSEAARGCDEVRP